ncbi:DUF3429 domain-containing protein [Tabrizicola sp. TH137]|uniref:DUF3429 domain-containing protein n=1 Tax=Tabrizicola sp. TH137 TaxID=2067452 RepID=UPI000C7C1F41|nr:DUF3429 domain-containing protein [Tabrizicola sp. TH137]PLL14206.1 DUF3429 domain-containing protein [Tabrizicola sp. TH137]
MTAIPRSALILGLAGLIPFLWGAANVVYPPSREWVGPWLTPMFRETYVILTYGVVILSFMSGVLWGFATKAEGRVAAVGYGLSVIPALWAFFMVNGAPGAAAVNLFAGFAGLLMLDYFFSVQGLTPAWWMRLRVLLTVVVLACVAVPILMG